jgi:hypothetical protein
MILPEVRHIMHKTVVQLIKLSEVKDKMHYTVDQVLKL